MKLESPTLRSHTQLVPLHSGIGWPLKATRRPKPAKECACPARKEKFSKMLHARQKKEEKRNLVFKSTLGKAATQTLYKAKRVDMDIMTELLTRS